MLTFGDYTEVVNVPNGETQFRCGICDRAFDSAIKRNIHHDETNEKKFEYHKPARVAGGLRYLVDAQGQRVTENGRRIDE